MTNITADATAGIDDNKRVRIHYKNWRGEFEWRVIVPQEIVFIKTVWHPEEQWCVIAYCCSRKAERVFAMKDILSWEIEPKQG